MIESKDPLAERKPLQKKEKPSVKLVPLGRIVATPVVLDTIPNAEIIAALDRHVRGDWGNVCKSDREKNDWALKNKERLLSSYCAENGTKFWIITEWDRSYTTVLLPSDY